MRFNQKGLFNVPFCRKPNRFSQAYVTKIVNQVKNLYEAMRGKKWQFEVLDFQQTLAMARENDFVYADAPYAGRHVDYFNSWSNENENNLIRALQKLPCRFILSTWHSNEYRENHSIQSNWQDARFFTKTCEHFYHVGATEELRNAMTEALIANYNMLEIQPLQPVETIQYTLPF
jgi:DNA adenine methylase